MPDTLIFNTADGSIKGYDKPSKPLTIAEYKEQGKWPFSYITGKGLVSVVDKLSDNLGRKVVGLEIGICKGENIVHFLEQTDKIEKIYCVDPYLPYMDWVGPATQEDVDEHFRITLENFKPHTDRIKMYKALSADIVNDFPDEFFDYIFIDGDHSYEGVKRDLEMYYPKIKKGGICAGHDFNLDEVRKAIAGFLLLQNIENPSVNLVETDAWFWVKP